MEVCFAVSISRWIEIIFRDCSFLIYTFLINRALCTRGFIYSCEWIWRNDQSLMESSWHRWKLSKFSLYYENLHLLACWIISKRQFLKRFIQSILLDSYWSTRIFEISHSNLYFVFLGYYQWNRITNRIPEYRTILNRKANWSKLNDLLLAITITKLFNQYQ